MKIICIVLALSVLLGGCSYLSSNIVKLRGEELKGHFGGTPVNISGKNIVITLYREMIFSWKNMSSKFAKTIKIEDDKEKGDILLEK